MTPKAIWITEQPCCVCRFRMTDAHHVKTRGAGGDDRYLVPLCRACHTEVHMKGVETFIRRFGVDLWRVAEMMEAQWRNGARPLRLLENELVY